MALVTFAGGIGNDGTLKLERGTVSGNTAGFQGGGIANYGGTVTIEGSEVSGNTAQLGGGIGNFGNLTLKDSKVTGNTATDFGGGIANFSNGTLTLRESRVSDNTAGGNGGGIFNDGGTVMLGGAGHLDMKSRKWVVGRRLVARALWLCGFGRIVGSPFRWSISAGMGWCAYPSRIRR